MKRLCPHCKSDVSESTYVDPKEKLTPTDGDVSLCIYCGKWGIFYDDGKLRLPTDLEASEIENDSECRRIRFALFFTNVTMKDRKAK